MVDSKYDPTQNRHLAGLLEANSVRFEGATPTPFINPTNDKESGATLECDEGLVLMLYPKLGTGVIDHERLDGNVTYLGLVEPASQVNPLKHKFDNRNPNPTPQDYTVRDRLLNERFNARGEDGRAITYGFHNGDPDFGAVVLITRR